MPDFYAPGEYDLAGFIVGVVDRSRLIDGSRIRPGDVLLGLSSAGLHTNGYSLARRLFFERLGLGPADRVPELDATVAEILLAPHRSYYGLLEPLLDSGVLRGMAHITGGGITDNLPQGASCGIGSARTKGIVACYAGIQVHSAARGRRRHGDVSHVQHGDRNDRSRRARRRRKGRCGARCAR